MHVEDRREYGGTGTKDCKTCKRMGVDRERLCSLERDRFRLMRPPLGTVTADELIAALNPAQIREDLAGRFRGPNDRPFCPMGLDLTAERELIAEERDASEYHLPPTLDRSLQAFRVIRQERATIEHRINKQIRDRGRPNG